jgi:hypothetical protein
MTADIERRKISSVSYPLPKGRGLRLVPVARLTPQVFYFNDTCLGHSLVIAKLPIGSFYGGSNPCSPVLLYLHRRYVPTLRG